MRKNLLALSIAAMVGGLSGVANAAVFTNTLGATVDLNDSTAVAAFVKANGVSPLSSAKAATALAPTTDGVGHILVAPYFSTQGKNKTLLSITNTDREIGKAVKLRFRGAANSDDIFDITVFLSPGDVWTATVGSTDGIISDLSTDDTSCTLPSIAEIKNQGGKFKLNRVEGEDPKQTREGYVEILNTADIPATSWTTAGVPVSSALYTAIKHVAGKAPCTAAVMNAQAKELVAGAANGNSPAVRGYSWPTGGLSANWIIVNTETMASSSGEAVAVRANGAGNIVWFPQTTDQITVDASTLTADPLLTPALDKVSVQVANYDFPDLSTPYVANTTPAIQADTLAAALATKSVTNDVLTDGFTTDWVFSMPTRRYAVALDYTLSGASRILFRELRDANNNLVLGADGKPQAVGNVYFNRVNTRLNKTFTQACVTPGALFAADREENTLTTFVISPDTALSFCGETSVLTFNNLGKASTLGALIARKDINTTFANGWFAVDTTNGGAGLPIVGFAAAKASGATNLGGTWKQRTSK